MITVEFKDFNEMVRFAKELLGVQTEETNKPEQAVQTAVPVVQPAAVPAPVALSAETAPVSTAVPADPVVPAAPATPAAPTTPAAPAIPTAPAQPVTPVVPTAAVAYTLDDLARAATTLMDAGRQGELIGLLQQFGVATLPALAREQYGAFATALRGMGAQI